MKITERYDYALRTLLLHSAALPGLRRWARTGRRPSADWILNRAVVRGLPVENLALAFGYIAPCSTARQQTGNWMIVAGQPRLVSALPPPLRTVNGVINSYFWIYSNDAVVELIRALEEMEHPHND